MRANRGRAHEPRALYSIESEQSDKHYERQSSPHSSRRSGSFMENEPTFESQNSDSETEIASVAPQREVVAVVWQNLYMEHKTKLLSKGEKNVVLKGVSGFAEPRGFLAVVGPAKSGKSSLVSVIGNNLWRRMKATGTLVINGRTMEDTWVKPTFLSSTDLPMEGISVEQALIYTAMLEMPDHGANLENEVRDICQRVGLLRSLSKDTHKLDVGTRRRVTVACHLLRCTSLLVCHDLLEGLQEGDALAIVRAIHDMTKEGCTAIMSCSQPSTDICTFFSRAYILVDGEVVYFGESGNQALELLSAAGMPCPPIYSPVEQYYRLIDPSFEVYLSVASERGTDDWNTQFSSLMVKVLQGAYQGSQAQIEADQKAAFLATSPYEPFKTKRGVSFGRQCYASVQLLVLQGLQGPALYLGRIVISVLFAVIYGGSYWHLNTSFRGAEERTTILFIASVILPSLAVGSLPLYRSSHRVFVKDRRRGRSGVITFFISFLVLTLLHLAAAAAFAAVIFIPMTKLNTRGGGYGYFIVNTTFAHMCADALILVFATLPATLGWCCTIAVLFVQMMACGFFPGANRGFNLPWHIVGFMPWSYKGLLQNEFLYRNPTTWDCPSGEGLEAFGGCQLDNPGMYRVLSQGQIVLTDSRWNSLYILLGIYFAWMLLFLAILRWKVRPNPVKLDAKYQQNQGLQYANGVHDNGINTNGEGPVHQQEVQDTRPGNIEMQNKNVIGTNVESPV